MYGAVRSKGCGSKGLAAVAITTLWLAAGCGKAEPAVGTEPIDTGADALGVAYDSGTSELVFELKPVDLPAHTGHHGITQPVPLEGIVPRDGWVNGYHVELLDRNGDAVPQTVLHHVNIIVPGRRELFSPIMQRLGAAGHETAPVKLPSFVGYPLSRGDRVLLSAMLHNPTDRSWEGVRVRVRFPHVDRGAFIRPLRIQPFYLDVMPPAGRHAFDLPPGEFEMSWEGRPAVSGRILGMGGHLHQYAESLHLVDLTSGDTLYGAAPRFDAAGGVEGMPQNMYLWRFGVPISRDHTYRLVVKYDNPTGDTIPEGGMGALGGIMLMTGDEEWPAIDSRDPEYVKDVRITLRQGGNDMDMGMDDEMEMPGHSHGRGGG